MHYRHGVIGVEVLIYYVPEIRQYARVTGERVCNINSHDITPGIWLNIFSRINALLVDPGVEGVIVTHWTDTLDETASFLNLAIRSEKHVILPGSMRPATVLSPDGPRNLLSVVRQSASGDAREKGVSHVLNGEINRARDETKSNIQSIHTFSSPYLGLFGYIEDGKPMIYRTSTRKNTPISEFNISGLAALLRVDIVMTYP